MSEEPVQGGNDDADAPVPRLPRGRGFKLTGPEVFRILLTGGMLVAVLVMAKPCGDAVSHFVMGFEGSGKGSAIPRPGAVELPGSAGAPGSVGAGNLPGSAGDYVELHAGMTDEQVKEAIDKARARHAAAAAGSGSAAGSAAAGSAAPAPGSAASSRP